MPGRDPVQVGKEIYESLGTPIIRSLDDNGITIDELTKGIAEGVKAVESKSFQYKGEVIESNPKIAWETRRAFIDMALKSGPCILPSVTTSRSRQSWSRTFYYQMMSEPSWKPGSRSLKSVR